MLSRPIDRAETFALLEERRAEKEMMSLIGRIALTVQGLEDPGFELRRRVFDDTVMDSC